MSDDIQARVAQIEAMRSIIGDAAADAALAALPRIAPAAPGEPAPTAPVDELVRFVQSLFAQLRASGVPFNFQGSNISIGNVIGGNQAQDNSTVQRLGESIERFLSVIAERERQPSVDDLIALEGLYREQIVETQRWLTFQGVVQTVRNISLPLAEVYVALQASSERSAAPAFAPDEARLLAQLEAADPAQRERLEQELELVQRGRWHSAPQRVEVAAALREHPTLVVLGDPGSGKSTLLRYLALAFAEYAAPQRLGLDEIRLPILVPLAAYEAARRERGDLALSDFLPLYYAEQREIPGLKPLFDQVLRHGQAIVLLDGLDEVTSDESRRMISQRVEAFVRRVAAQGNRIVLTSRIVGYRSAPLPGDLPHYTVLDFGPAEIERFTSRWCRAYEVAQHGESAHALREADAEQRRLLDAINDNPSVTRLAANPLLLTILALIHRQGKSLPRRRIELYDLYARTLLESWNRARSLSGRQAGISFDLVREVQILAPLALWLHTSKPAGTARRAELLRELRRIMAENDYANPAGEAERWLRDVAEHSSLLVERGVDAWGFLHLTFQEYFAARAIAMLPAAERFPRLRRHLHDARWREVILLAAGQIGVMEGRADEVTRFVEQIWRATPPPSNRMVQIEPPGRIGKLFLKANPTYQLWERIETQLRRNLLLAAAMLNDDVGVKPALAESIAQAVAEVWREKSYLRESINELIKGGRGLRWVSQLLEDVKLDLIADDYDIRIAAVKALGAGQEWDTIRLSLTDTSESVRLTVVRLLGIGQEWDAIYLLLADENTLLREAAVDALGKGKQWDVIRPALADEVDSVRLAVVKAFEVGQQWAAIRPALADDYFLVRLFALNALAVGQQWETIHPILADGDVNMRRLAVELFGAEQQWEAIRPALSDESDFVRLTAVKAFAAGQQREAILPALADDDHRVRQVAVRIFGTGQQWDAIRPALADDDWTVRQAAVEAFGAGQQWDAIRPALVDDDHRVRRVAVRVFGAGQQWDAIRPALADDDWTVREVTVEAFGAGQQWEAIRPALTDEDEHVRRVAVKAFGSGQRWEAIRPALTDEDEHVRRVAVEAFGSGQQWEAIRPALDDESDDVQVETLEILSKHHDPTLGLITTITTILQNDSNITNVAYTTLLALVNRYEANLAAAEIAAEEEG